MVRRYDRYDLKKIEENLAKVQEAKDAAVADVVEYNKSHEAVMSLRSPSGMYLVNNFSQAEQDEIMGEASKGHERSHYRAVSANSITDAFSKVELENSLNEVWIDNDDMIGIGVKPEHVGPSGSDLLGNGGFIMSKKTGDICSVSGYSCRFQKFPVQPIENYVGPYKGEDGKYYLRDIDGTTTQADSTHSRYDLLKNIDYLFSSSPANCSKVGMRFLTDKELAAISKLELKSLFPYGDRKLIENGVKAYRGFEEVRHRGSGPEQLSIPKHVNKDLFLGFSKIFQFDKDVIAKIEEHPSKYISTPFGTSAKDVMKEFKKNQAFFTGAELPREMQPQMLELMSTYGNTPQNESEGISL